MSSSQQPGPLERRLYLGAYGEIFKEFSDWRMDSYIRLLERIKKKGWGKVLPFVRGLRLSARLIYVIRKHLEGSNLAADWGHLMGDAGEYLSPECDIIIYEKRGMLEEWNDKTKNAVMNFKFVKASNAKLVISCKSFLKTNNIEEEYCTELRKHVDKVWIFAECCGPRSVENIRKKAEAFGYKMFFYIYTWSRKQGLNANEEGWIEFIKALRSLNQD